MPAKEAVTTNFDQLFERAWDDASKDKSTSDQKYRPTLKTSIIPHQQQADHDRWLLKLHGCVSHPESMVLTRESYIRFNAQWAALEGILQATLLTRHMLFVGFSLKDDNFIRILDAVRRIVRPQAALKQTDQPFSTVLMLGQDSVMQQLFQQDLEWVGMTKMDESAMSGEVFAEQGRKLELFLDCLLAHTRDTAHLLHPKFGDVLAEDEKSLAEQLKLLAKSIPSAPDRSPAWNRVEDLLREFGWRGQTKDQGSC